MEVLSKGSLDAFWFVACNKVPGLTRLKPPLSIYPTRHNLHRSTMNDIAESNSSKQKSELNKSQSAVPFTLAKLDPLRRHAQLPVTF